MGTAGPGSGEETDPGEGNVDPGAGETAPASCARRLLEAVRAGDDPDPFLSELAGYDHGDLAPIRGNRSAALAFWTNVYNAGAQVLLSDRPGRYESALRVVRFFGTPCVAVAGTELSLDDVEHGILRGGRSKYGLGYVGRFRPSAFERRYSLADPDPRVHFALNCGAASCPAIRSYDPDRVDAQLDLATRTYLRETVEYDPERDRVRVPRLFLWYRGDFGGGDGIVEFLREYDAVPADATPRLRYRSWDWTREVGKFVDPAGDGD